jgi:DNA repair protein RecO (recombination protein O)
MNETYNINAIILSRQPFKEFDDRVVVYSPEIGLKELVVRGTKKVLSKLSGHIEPLSLSSLMVVRGKQYDYAGTVVSLDCFQNLKKDFQKVMLAGRVSKIFNDFMKQDYPDQDLYDLLKEFLVRLDSEILVDEKLLKSAFVFKFFQEMGQLPDFANCALCHKSFSATGNSFVGQIGSVVCADCAHKKGFVGGAVISRDGLKISSKMVTMSLREIGMTDCTVKVTDEINNFSDYFLEIMREK